ncbi:MAG: proteasome subunit alpha [Armatimonadota bacterium]
MDNPAPDFATLVGWNPSVAAPNAASDAFGSADIHGTTVIAVKYRDGVLTVGDRRATGGSAIMYDKAEKVLPLDDHTLMAISGSFSRAMEFARYLRHAFKYYERSQLQTLSLDGKLNEIGRLMAGNMAGAMSGVGLVIPVVAAWDAARGEGRIFFYDAGGARFETGEYGAAGSGSGPIRGAFEYVVRTKGPFAAKDLETALGEALALLEIAADLDSATGGASKVLPIARVVTAQGVADVPSDLLARAVEGVVKTGTAL